MWDPPLEIAGLVLEETESDPNVLRACSLVSRSWLHASRTHDPLFTRIVLRFDSLSAAEKILDILKSPCCTFIRHVLELRIFPSKRSSPASERFMHEAITQLGELPNVQTLYIHYDSHVLHDDVRDLLPVALPSIKSLRILNTFPSLSQAIHFVSLFTKLEHLDFDPYLLKNDTLPSEDLHLPPDLHSLHLQLRGVDRHERWFAENRAYSNLKASVLTLSGIRTPANIATVEQILHLFGEDLRELSLRLDKKEVFQVNLSHTTALRRLEVRMQSDSFSEYLEASHRKITPTLSSLRAPHLEEISWWTDGSTIEPMQISELDTLLANRSVFPVLTRFSIVGPKISDLLTAGVKMPKSSEAGIRIAIHT
ncbi:hypothetical protein B0H11DRAFT_2246242 [Mycena galericulata]|nr:hypothetical protein B0H11DRAFT_2246242 [Mycena galericulata]